MKQVIFSLIFALYSLSSWAFMPKTFEAQVIQKQKSALSGRIKESRGKLTYRYPGHLRFEIEKPDEVTFVSNKFKTWYYTGPFIDGESGEVTISNEGDHILTKFFDSFSKGFKTNSLYEVEMADKLVEVTFDKKLQKELGVLSATFIFKTKKHKFEELEKLNILQHDKQELTLMLEDIKFGQNFSDQIFVFQVPENTKIIQ